MGMSGKSGGGAPQQQTSYGGKGGGGAPQGQGVPGMSGVPFANAGMPPPPQGMPQTGGPMPPNPQMPQRDPAQMQQQYDQFRQQMQSRQPPPGMEGMRPPGMGYDQQQQQRMQQMMAMDRDRGMGGGINSLQKPPMPPPPGAGGAPMFLGDQGTATPNTMPPPPAAATGASPGGPLSGRNFNPGFGGQRGFGMGRFGGYRGQGGGRFGGMGQINPTPAGADTSGLASLPQGYATGGRVSWSAAPVSSVGAAPTAATNGMFSGTPLAAIQQPAAYVRPATTQAIWSPPAAAAATSANKGGPYGGLTQAQWALKHGYGTLNPSTGIYEKSYRGGSGSHGGGRG